MQQFGPWLCAQVVASNLTLQFCTPNTLMTARCAHTTQAANVAAAAAAGDSITPAGSKGGKEEASTSSKDGPSSKDKDSSKQTADAPGASGGSTSGVAASDDYPVAAINAAHLLVLQQRHASALQLLEPLFDGIESINGGAALHLCLLLLEVYLASRQHTKAAGVIGYLETAFGLVPEAGQLLHAPRSGSDGGCRGDSGSRAGTPASPGEGDQQQQQQPPSTTPPGSDQQQQQQEADASGGRDASRQGADDVSLVDEAAALQLPRVSRATSPLMERVVAVLEPRGGSGAAGMPDLRLLLRLLRARLALSARYPKAAKRDVKALLTVLPRCEAALMLKAQLEASRGHPRRALRTLGPLLALPPPTAAAPAAMGGSKGTGAGVGGEVGGGGGNALSRPTARVALLNNLGVVHHQFGKHQMAAIYLSRALMELAAAKPGSTAAATITSTEGGSSSGSGERSASSSCKAGGSSGSGGRAAGGRGTKQGRGGSSSSGSGASAGAAASRATQPAKPQQRQFGGLWADHSHALQYNLGLQHLMLRNWQAALACFDAATQRFYMQPLLWLRMAEANVGLHCEQGEQQRQAATGGKDSGGSGSSSGRGNGVTQGARATPAAGGGSCLEGAGHHPLVAGVAGSGPRRRLLLPAGHVLGPTASLTDAAGATAAPSEDAWHEGPLGAALLQLHTALALLQDCKAEAAKEAEEAAAAAAALGSGPSPNGRRCNEGSPPASDGRRGSGDASPSSGGGLGTLSGGGVAGVGGAGRRMLSDCWPAEELESMGQAIWANLAYVHLLRDDPVPALAAAQQLLACSGLSAQQHYLGSCYAAEAQCMLGRPEEAAEQLRGHLALFHGAGTSGDGEQSSTPPAATVVGAAQRIGSSGGGGGGVDASHIGGGVAVAGGAPSISIKSDDDASSAREWYTLGNAADAAALVGPRARAGALSNLAAVFAMRGDLEEARRLAQQALAASAEAVAAAAAAGSSLGADSSSAAAAAQLLLVYCELRRGDSAAALALLRQAGSGSSAGRPLV